MCFYMWTDCALFYKTGRLRWAIIGYRSGLRCFYFSLSTISTTGKGYAFFMFPDSSHYKKYSSHYKKYNGNCLMYLGEILSKLQMYKVGLLIILKVKCNLSYYQPHTFNFFYFPLVLFHVCRWNIKETAILWNFK